jgi:hypothetical protein
VLSARDLCVGLITRSEEAYRVLCVCVCGDEVSVMRRPCPSRGSRAMKKVDDRGVFSYFLVLQIDNLVHIFSSFYCITYLI